MIIENNISISEKLAILGDAAKYDVACTSSGVGRSGKKGMIGNTLNAGICHTFSADGRCISLLKILMTNECIFDCKYCSNRASNDIPRATFTPEEICKLTIEFYRRNYIEGLFLSSGVIENPDYTMELIFQTVWRLREEYRFNGYIHVKAIPGASAELIDRIGYVTDRMSINIEFPTAKGLKELAPHKSRKNILTPMKQIQQGIKENKYRINNNSGRHSYRKQIMQTPNTCLIDVKSDHAGNENFAHSDNTIIEREGQSVVSIHNSNGFVPAGQSTQMIIGATPENDYHIMTVAETLYNSYDLKRVFYSAYISVNEDRDLPALGTAPPLLREHRLYQADWLLRFYGFKVQELLNEANPNFNVLLDPKCDWAVRHLEQFPVEINKADYYTLLRVPGIGVKSAKRIISARKSARLNFMDIKKMGVVLKRALYFITCMGKMMYDTKIEENYITNHLIYNEKPVSFEMDPSKSYRQLNLFDDMNINMQPTQTDLFFSATGQI